MWSLPLSSAQVGALSHVLGEPISVSSLPLVGIEVEGTTPSTKTLASDVANQRQSSMLGQPAGDGATQAKQAQAAAAKVYDQHKDEKYDLKDPARREQLVAASSQVDNNPETTNDNTRCGGAALMNTMILDGDPRKNAEAIEKTARQSDTKLSTDEKDALKSMKEGNLTPRQTGNLQELMLRMGDGMDRQNEAAAQENARATGAPVKPTTEYRNNDGISPAGMAALSSSMRANGAYSSPSSVEFNMEQRTTADGRTADHWTATVKNQQGTRTADSWPGKDGHASVTNQDAPQQAGPWPPPGERAGKHLWMGKVSLLNDASGSQVDARMWPEQTTRGGDKYVVFSEPVRPGGVRLEDVPPDRIHWTDSRTHSSTKPYTR